MKRGSLRALCRPGYAHESNRARAHRADPGQAAQSGKGKRMIIGDTPTNTIEPSLVRLIHEALAVRCVVLADARETLNEITARRKKSKGNLTSLMRMSYLAPQIIDDILNVRQPPELSVKRLLRTSSTCPCRSHGTRIVLTCGSSDGSRPDSRLSEKIRPPTNAPKETVRRTRPRARAKNRLWQR